MLSVPIMEPFGYRARKWLIQKISSIGSAGDQIDRLDAVDWDVLLVLDACRLDTLREVTYLPIRAAQSPGSTTSEWLETIEQRGVFADKYLVTANSQYVKFDLDEQEIHYMWEDGWDDDLGTVHPDPVLERCNELIENRQTPVVGHLLPPHAPYVGLIGDTWLPLMPEVDIWKLHPEDIDKDLISPQMAMASGKVDLSRAFQAYQASVESIWQYALGYIGPWVKSGSTVVVTADHGETFGRARDLWLYEHPYNCHISPLVDVPFVEFDSGTAERKAPETVDEHLEALGYV